jgi:hypothetical protein
MTQQYNHMKGRIVTAFYPQSKVDGMFWPVTDWINQNLVPGTGLAVKDHGRISYFTNVRVVDLAGIIDPSMITHVKEGTMNYYLQKNNVEYILMREGCAGYVFDAICNANLNLKKVVEWNSVGVYQVIP